MRSIGLALCAALLWATWARAEGESARVRALYQQGMVHYELEEYDAAIAKWQDGFRLRPAAEFLYNIAQAYRLSKRPEKAMTYYRKYLSMLPDAPNRGEVEQYIDELRRAIDELRKAAPSPSRPLLEQNGAGGEVRKTALRQPAYKKPWFWGVMTGAAIVVAGGITLGVVLGTRDTTRTLPDVSF